MDEHVDPMGNQWEINGKVMAHNGQRGLNDPNM